MISLAIATRKSKKLIQKQALRMFAAVLTSGSFAKVKRLIHMVANHGMMLLLTRKKEIIEIVSH